MMCLPNGGGSQCRVRAVQVGGIQEEGRAMGEGEGEGEDEGV
jgi:hypothetical protein